MFNFSRGEGTQAKGARGYRAYVVGDIHGRLDLLEDLLAKVHAELQHRPARKTLLAFVGDLIDRGPSSAQVIERLRIYRRNGIQPVYLLGNHEEVLLRILGGDETLISSWLQFGGLQCLEELWGRTAEAARSIPPGDYPDRPRCRAFKSRRIPRKLHR